MQLHILLAASFAWVTGNQQAPTYRHRDPSTGELLLCRQCPPGTAVQSHCTPSRPTLCIPCPADHFSEHWHWGEGCRHCRAVCKERQLVRRECNGTHDRLCECEPGRHLQVEFCVRHTACPPGSGVRVLGTPERNTVCEECPKGYFSSVVSATEPCIPHRNCSMLGMRTLKAGSAVQDSVCRPEGQCFPLKAECHTGALLCGEVILDALGLKQLDSLAEHLPGRKVDRRSMELARKECGAQQGALRLLRLWREQNRDQERLFFIMEGVDRCERMLLRNSNLGNLTPRDLRTIASSLPGKKVHHGEFRHLLKACRPRQLLLQLLYVWRVQNMEQNFAEALEQTVRKLHRRNVSRRLLGSLRSVKKILGAFFAHKTHEKLSLDKMNAGLGLTAESHNNKPRVR